MIVGSLFSGIGGIDLGLERAGMRVAWQCEADPYCRAVLRKHWPLVPCYDDVRTIHHGDAEPVDVLAGGFPCQSISHNGHGLVRADERWLWPEFARLIGILRPRYVLVENVAALLGRGFHDVITDLAALRYDAEWDCLRASDAAAPHRRERIYLVAYPQCVGREEGPRVFTGQPQEDLPQPATWSGVSDRDVDGSLRLVPPSDVQRVADGSTAGLERLRVVGNSVLPQISEWIGRRLMVAA